MLLIVHPEAKRASPGSHGLFLTKVVIPVSTSCYSRVNLSDSVLFTRFAGGPEEALPAP